MQETGYNHLISEVKALELSDQLRLLEQIAFIIRHRSATENTRSILELKGKGKDIWNDINVKSYLDMERSSWNG
jgi:DNA-binding HxlR family transcriptional regulator